MTTANIEFFSAVNTRAINIQLTNRYMRQLTNFNKLLSEKITKFSSLETKLPSNLKRPPTFNFIPDELLRFYHNMYIKKNMMKTITLIFKIVAFVTLICACLILNAFVYRMWKIMIKIFDLVRALKIEKKKGNSEIELS